MPLWAIAKACFKSLLQTAINASYFCFFLSEVLCVYGHGAGLQILRSGKPKNYRVTRSDVPLVLQQDIKPL